MSTTMAGIRITDMPDLGAVTGTSSLVGEHAGSGRFSATSILNYVGTSLSYTQAGTGGVSRLLPQRIAEILFVDEYDTLAHAKAAAVALPLFDAQHGRLHLRTGLNASYDMAANVLGVGLTFDTDGSTVTVPAGKVLAHITIGNGADQQFMLGASAAQASLITFNMSAAAGSDATSKLYGVIGNLTNHGAGSTKAIYGRATPVAGATGTVMGLVGGVTSASTLSHVTALQLTGDTVAMGGKVNEFIWCSASDGVTNMFTDFGLLLDKPVAVNVAGIRQFSTGPGDLMQLLDGTGATILFAIDNAGVIKTCAGIRMTAGAVISFNTAAASATAGSSGALPAQVGGYLNAQLAGVAIKIPYYGV